MRDVYAGIDQIVLRDGFAAAPVCDLLEVSRSGFYAWRSKQESERERRDQELVPVIQEVFWHHQRRHGARRIAVELSSRGIACGVARVVRLLKTQGLKAIQPKSFQPRTTESRHGLGDNANLLVGRGEAASKIDDVWVADFTDIPLATRTSRGRFGYLALLMDLCSRRIVGWEYGSSMDEELVLGALKRAIVERQSGVGLIHHSNRGGQYAGGRYREVLRRSGMRQSMSAAGNCYDNAFMESCFGTVKTELELVEYGSEFEARRELSSYVGHYNVERRHSALGVRVPGRAREAINRPEIRDWTVRAN